MSVVARLLLLSVILSAGCGKPSKQSSIAASVQQLGDEASKFVLYSLKWGNDHDEKVNTDAIFHGYEILGSAEITDVAKKRALLRALAQGVRNNDGSYATCFLPRYAIRMENNGRSIDFTISFLCHQVKAYGFEHSDWFVTSEFPKAAFDEAATTYHLPRLPE